MNEQAEKEANGDLRECAGRLVAAALQIRAIGTLDQPWLQRHALIGEQIAEIRNALSPLVSWYQLIEQERLTTDAATEPAPPPTTHRSG